MEDAAAATSRWARSRGTVTRRAAQWIAAASVSAVKAGAAKFEITGNQRLAFLRDQVLVGEAGPQVANPWDWVSRIWVPSGDSRRLSCWRTSRQPTVFRRVRAGCSCHLHWLASSYRDPGPWAGQKLGWEEVGRQAQPPVRLPCQPGGPVGAIKGQWFDTECSLLIVHPRLEPQSQRKGRATFLMSMSPVSAQPCGASRRHEAAGGRCARPGPQLLKLARGRSRTSGLARRRASSGPGGQSRRQAGGFLREARS